MNENTKQEVIDFVGGKFFDEIIQPLVVDAERKGRVDEFNRTFNDTHTEQGSEANYVIPVDYVNARRTELGL